MTITDEQRLRRATRSLLAVLGLLGTAITMSFFDRPIALWSRRVFLGTRTLAASEFILGQLEHVGMLGGILLITGAVAWVVNRRSPSWVKRYVIAATSAAVAIAITQLLKWACGRSEPLLLFEANHIYAFRPLSGKPEYMDFPSGTLTVTLGFITGWNPEGWVQRALAWIVTSVFVLALLFANGHWVSDMIAGALVGWAVGLAIRLAFARRLSTPALRPSPALD